ncbi:hypothetical protein ABT388_33760 [Streptomyces collinus]|uniref:hypothetical protein n=1 Tax=Streptomyces collinus TaxID=42684 RepID=UPI0019BCBD9A|nr:hypothetical protein GCM10010309_65800 [Streptomyces violaceochromogenes]
MTTTTSQLSESPVQLASAIGSVLTDTTASAQEQVEIRAITDAMIRLLAGAPLRSDGKLTIKSLAAEAGLRRNKLTHKHTGLKDLFYALVRAQAGRPAIADRLHHDNEALRAALTRAKEERDQLKAQVQQLARVVQVLEVENEQLRRGGIDRRTVRAFPGPRS